MKHLCSALIVGVMATFAGCKSAYDAPPLNEPTYSGTAANITIADLKAKFPNVEQGTPQLIETDYVIKAVVVGNDKSGNIYKQVYIEDETGGINIGVDQNSVYTEYHVGQEVYLNAKGLYMVMYGGQLQIGFNNTQANRIPYEMFKYYVQKNGWPKSESAQPKVVQLNQLNDSMVNTLIRLDNVRFAEGGKATFSTSDRTTNRTLSDNANNSIIVRTSNYSNFANDMLPEGTGTVVGILSKYNSTWQLILRSKDDVMDFVAGNTGGNGSDSGWTDDKQDPPSSAEKKTIKTFEFGSTDHGFTFYEVTMPEGGSYVWTTDTNYKNIKASGFVKGAKDAEGWAISPAIDLTGVTAPIMNINQVLNFAKDRAKEQTIWVSTNYTDGDPSKATWTELTVPTWPAGTDWKPVDSGDIDLKVVANKSNVRIGFKYISTTNNAATWQVKKVEIKG